MRPKKLDKLLLNLETQPSEDLDRRIAAMMTQAAQQGSGSVSPERVLWRYLMQSKMTKLAAAIAIVLCVMVALYSFNSTTSVTWAGVIDPLMTARTATFDVITNYQSVTGEMKIMIMDQMIRYEYMTQGSPIVVFDTESFQMLTLIPDRRQATLIDLKNLPDETPENYLESIREVITELQSDPNATFNQLPDTVINGRLAVVFQAYNVQGEITVWADPETLIPIRLEQTYKDLNVVCTNLQFDIKLDPSLFNMDIPEGYRTVSGEMDLGESTEQNLIEGLRIWAQTLEDNQFPKDLSVATYMEAMPRVRQKLTNGTLTLSMQQKLDMGLKIHRAYQFVTSLKPEQNWHYVGADVPFGDANEPLCWYKPIGSETYRVVFGDLSVKELDAEDLPK